MLTGLPKTCTTSVIFGEKYALNSTMSVKPVFCSGGFKVKQRANVPSGKSGDSYLETDHLRRKSQSAKSWYAVRLESKLIVKTNDTHMYDGMTRGTKKAANFVARNFD